MQVPFSNSYTEAQTILAQLNTVPGISGSLLCDDEGRCVAHVVPSRYGDDLLALAARLVADARAGLGAASSDVSSLDFRFGDSRLVLRPLVEGTLLVICSPDTNPYFLAPSLAAAGVRLAKLHFDTPPPMTAPPPPARAAAPAAQASVAPAAVQAAETTGRRHPKLGVPAPTRGLEELYRRLGERPAK